MNIWENAVLTLKGTNLLAKLIEGTALEITRAEVGTGYITPGLLTQLERVTTPMQELRFRPVTYPEAGKCKLPGYLTNDGLNTGYTATQVGVYAMDPDEGEILFFVVQATSGTGTVIPSESEMPGYSAEWSLYFQYGQADSVEVVVDPSNGVSREELDSLIANELAKKSDNGHTHTASEVAETDNLKFNRIVNITSSDGSRYTGTAEGIDTLYDGLEIIVIANMTSVEHSLYLKINASGWDPVVTKNPVSFETFTLYAGALGPHPTRLRYENKKWIAVDYPYPTYQYSSEDLTAGTSSLDTGALYFVYE